MLYHVLDLELALRELGRVLRPGGRLVTTTNGSDHLLEMFELADIERFVYTFSAENGADILARHFPHVEQRAASGTVTFRDSEQIRSYLRSSARLAPGADRIPERTEPLVARRHHVVFIAEKAA